MQDDSVCVLALQNVWMRVCFSQCPTCQGCCQRNARGQWVVARVRDGHVQLQPTQLHHWTHDGLVQEAAGVEDDLGYTLHSNRLWAEISMWWQHALASRFHVYDMCDTYRRFSLLMSATMVPVDIWVLKADTSSFKLKMCWNNMESLFLISKQI